MFKPIKKIEEITNYSDLYEILEFCRRLINFDTKIGINVVKIERNDDFIEYYYDTKTRKETFIINGEDVDFGDEEEEEEEEYMEDLYDDDEYYN